MLHKVRMIFYFCIVENVIKHIEKLLAQHDYVVVPGLGGFFVRREPAKILADKIMPPVATVSFNPLMQHADGLLAIEISKAEQISYRQAVEYLDKVVRKYTIKATTTKGKIAFGALGAFALSESGLLVFYPAEKADFLPANFLLTELNVQPRYYRIERSHGRPKRRTTMKLYRYAAVALALVGLFMATSRVNDVKRTEYAGVISSIGLLTDTLKTQPVRIHPVILRHADISSDSLNKKVRATAKVHSFYVVISSVGDRDAANRLCEQLKKEQYTSATVLATEKTFRTSLKSFDNLDDALDYMKEIRKTDSRFQNAWVKCN